MPISPDLVPSTVHQAAELLASSLSDNEREYFRITPVETLVGNCGLSLRTGWSLWKDTLLRYDAARHYGNAHPDDISSLVIHWARAASVLQHDDQERVCKRVGAGEYGSGDDSKPRLNFLR